MNATITTTEKTVRYIWKCRYVGCKHVWALDYTEITYTTEDHWGKNSVTHTYRMLPDGTKRSVSTDIMGELRCPKCSCNLPKGNKVEGHYSEKHVCGARCVNATGPNCDCQCGGENHGKNHLS